MGDLITSKPRINEEKISFFAVSRRGGLNRVQRGVVTLKRRVWEYVHWHRSDGFHWEGDFPRLRNVILHLGHWCLPQSRSQKRTFRQWLYH